MSVLTSLLMSMRLDKNNPKLEVQLIQELNLQCHNGRLDLSFFKFDDYSKLLQIDLMHLFGALEHTPVTHLILSNCGLDYQNAIIIAGAFKKNNLIQLDLSNNNIQKTGAIVIAKALEENTTLKYLNLKNNAISTFVKYPNCESSSLLITLIQKNKTLTILDLRDNQIDVSNLLALITASLDNFSLRQLLIGEGSGLGQDLYNQTLALSNFIRSTHSRAIIPLLYVPTQNLTLIDNHYPGASSLFPNAIRDHRIKIEALFNSYATDIEIHLPAAIGSIIVDCLTDNDNLKSAFLIAYQNTLKKKSEAVITPKTDLPAPLLESETKYQKIMCCTLL